jgi:hypothetical protein
MKFKKTNQGLYAYKVPIKKTTTNPNSNTEDINLAEQIFGENIRFLKEKTTRRKSTPVADYYIHIPTELTMKQQDTTLCINSINVNSLTFLTIVSKNLCYRTAQFVIDKLVSNYKATLHKVFQVYNKQDSTSKKSDATTNSNCFWIHYVNCIKL